MFGGHDKQSANNSSLVYLQLISPGKGRQLRLLDVTLRTAMEGQKGALPSQDQEFYDARR